MPGQTPALDAQPDMVGASLWLVISAGERGTWGLRSFVVVPLSAT